MALLHSVVVAPPRHFAGAPSATDVASCPLGHGGMDSLVRDGVRVAVCGECASTFFAPGQLEALVKKLAERSGEGLWRFLDGDGD